MDIGSLLLGCMLGIVGTISTEVVRHKLTVKNEKEIEMRQKTLLTIERAYWPIINCLDEMLLSFPNHHKERNRLKKIMDTQGYLLDENDQANIRVTLLKSVTIEDISKVRELVNSSVERRSI